MWRPMAGEAVAPGDGALTTWTAPAVTLILKSSTSEPSGLGLGADAGAAGDDVRRGDPARAAAAIARTRPCSSSGTSVHPHPPVAAGHRQTAIGEGAEVSPTFTVPIVPSRAANRAAGLHVAVDGAGEDAEEREARVRHRVTGPAHERAALRAGM